MLQIQTAGTQQYVWTFWRSRRGRIRPSRKCHICYQWGVWFGAALRNTGVLKNYSRTWGLLSLVCKATRDIQFVMYFVLYLMFIYGHTCQTWSPTTNSRSFYGDCVTGNFVTCSQLFKLSQPLLYHFLWNIVEISINQLKIIWNWSVTSKTIFHFTFYTNTKHRWPKSRSFCR